MATTNTISEYRAHIRIVRKIMLCAGLWPVTEPNLFYKWFSTFLCIVGFLSSCVTINFVFAHVSNISLMTQAWGATATCVTITVKLFICNPNRKSVRELHETLDRMTNEILNDTVNGDLISSEFTIIRRLSTTFSCFVCASVTSLMIYPIIYIILQVIHQVHPINYRLPMTSTYPWPITGGSFLFYCHYIFELINGYSAVVVTSGVDTYFMMCILQMSWKLRVMSHQFMNLMHDVEYEKTVHKCMINYQALLRCRDNIEKIYGPLILWLILSSALVLCSIVFQLTKIESLPPSRVFSFILFMSSRLLHVFIYTWCGSMLTSESEKFTVAIYSSGWPASGEKRLTSSILIMLIQKPLLIKACSYAPISIDLFAKTLNTTISYFFILRTMESKGN